MLHDAGADDKVRNAQGLTALEFAQWWISDIRSADQAAKLPDERSSASDVLAKVTAAPEKRGNGSARPPPSLLSATIAYNPSLPPGSRTQENLGKRVKGSAQRQG
eukprot:6864886-Prymnesium_polylepis.1